MIFSILFFFSLLISITSQQITCFAVPTPLVGISGQASFLGGAVRIFFFFFFE